MQMFREAVKPIAHAQKSLYSSLHVSWYLCFDFYQFQLLICMHMNDMVLNKIISIFTCVEPVHVHISQNNVNY